MPLCSISRMLQANSVSDQIQWKEDDSPGERFERLFDRFRTLKVIWNSCWSVERLVSKASWFQAKRVGFMCGTEALQPSSCQIPSGYNQLSGISSALQVLCQGAVKANRKCTALSQPCAIGLLIRGAYLFMIHCLVCCQFLSLKLLFA